MEPGERYISRVRSNHAQPIQDVFAQINDRVNEEMAAHLNTDNASKSKYSVGNCFRACSLRNIWKNSIESVHPFTSEQLDAQEFDISWEFQYD
jgi:amidophosphoribosyltransferase